MCKENIRFVMKQKSKILGIIMAVIGLALCVFGVVIRHQKLNEIELNHSRPNNSYYHYSDFYGYFEIKTDANIDVDNCFVNIYDTYMHWAESVKLRYEGKENGYYVFTINEGGNYTITSLDLVDLSGNPIEVIKYTEMEELARKAAWEADLDKANVYIFMFIAGLFTLGTGIVVYFKNKIFMPKSMAHIKKTPSGVCKYCGTKNRLDDTRCYGCGANLKEK